MYGAECSPATKAAGSCLIVMETKMPRWRLVSRGWVTFAMSLYVKGSGSLQLLIGFLKLAFGGMIMFSALEHCGPENGLNDGRGNVGMVRCTWTSRNYPDQALDRVSGVSTPLKWTPQPSRTNAEEEEGEGSKQQI
ncbi:unnamed protein product [Heligmosomoides polygyrus]|uniref:Uncharacterized protein n=1 Tax=Heligmosomoides polygyrus TaxID=6339 RepID=A0A183F736_HELPZ|nr:unnamed protein product [Heligmosomoides polygyrus]